MSLYSHKIFKLALLKDAVYAAYDFMHCLDVPQAPFRGSAMPLWWHESDWSHHISAPNTQPGLHNCCSH